VKISEGTQITLLAIVIFFVTGIIVYLKHNPPEPWLDKSTQTAVEKLIDETCPEMQPVYDSKLDEGRIDMYVIEDVLSQCSEELKGMIMYQRIVRELSYGP